MTASQTGAPACRPGPLWLDRRRRDVHRHSGHGGRARGAGRADRAAGTGVRLERHDDLRCDFAQYPAGRADRTVRRGAAPDDRAAAHRAAVAGAVAAGRGRQCVCARAMGTLCHVGRAGRHRLGRRHDRHGDSGGEPLVRRTSWPGGWPADRQQCQRTTGVPAVAGQPCRDASAGRASPGRWRW